MRRLCLAIFSLVMLGLMSLGALAGGWSRVEAVTSKSGSVGVQGTVPGNPPTQGATITFPKDGQTFTTNPVTVTGICPNGLLVKSFDNNVFVGSAQCTSGNFSIIMDLFSGRNELVARVYDDLDQAGPDSNIVTVTLNDSRAFTGNSFTITSNFAKRGANPGETLSWPVSISGGTPPYALSVSWGDSKPPDLISRTIAGSFDITHVYDAAGIYTILIKAADSDGNTAFLQLVGVANGQITQANAQPKGPTVITKTVAPLWAFLLMLAFIIAAFWLGKRHELRTLLRRTQTEQTEAELPPATIDARSDTKK